MGTRALPWTSLTKRPRSLAMKVCPYRLTTMRGLAWRKARASGTASSEPYRARRPNWPLLPSRPPPGDPRLWSSVSRSWWRGSGCSPRFRTLGTLGGLWVEFMVSGFRVLAKIPDAWHPGRAMGE
ncbi:hypothetical protein EGW08_007847, partial [Elysia chlorotica]